MRSDCFFFYFYNHLSSFETDRKIIRFFHDVSNDIMEIPIPQFCICIISVQKIYARKTYYYIFPPIAFKPWVIYHGHSGLADLILILHVFTYLNVYTFLLRTSIKFANVRLFGKCVVRRFSTLTKISSRRRRSVRQPYGIRLESSRGQRQVVEEDAARNFRSEPLVVCTGKIYCSLYLADKAAFIEISSFNAKRE